MNKITSILVDQAFVALGASLIGWPFGWQVAAGVYVVTTIVLNNVRALRK